MLGLLIVATGVGVVFMSWVDAGFVWMDRESWVRGAEFLPTVAELRPTAWTIVFVGWILLYLGSLFCLAYRYQARSRVFRAILYVATHISPGGSRTGEFPRGSVLVHSACWTYSGLVCMVSGATGWNLVRVFIAGLGLVVALFYLLVHSDDLPDRVARFVDRILDQHPSGPLDARWRRRLKDLDVVWGVHENRNPRHPRSQALPPTEDVAPYTLAATGATVLVAVTALAVQVFLLRLSGTFGAVATVAVASLFLAAWAMMLRVIRRAGMAAVPSSSG